MTISAVRHNEIVRMMAEGTLSYGEIASRVKCSLSTVKTRIGAGLKTEPLFCYRHNATTEVDAYRWNVDNGLPGCNMCAAEVGSTYRFEDGPDDSVHCQLGLNDGDAKRMERVRNGEVDCRPKSKTKGESK